MRNIHIVSHTHWDREWYRPFQLFRLKLVHLVDGLLELIEKDPHFKFFMLDGQTIVLDDYLAMRPEKEDELRRLIQKGRLLIGPWHILPDMFLVGPESHIRNLLQGDRTAQKFGKKMLIGYIPDPFGHPAQVPQILQGFGIDTACLWRGLDEEPAEFWWQSPDGSRVLMAYIRDSYSNAAGFPTNNPSAFAEAVAAEQEKLAPHSQVSNFLMMLGTDHMEPSPNTSLCIDFADKNLPDMHVIHSTLPQFVEAVRQEITRDHLSLPAVTGELRSSRRSHLLPGVLSARMWIKQRNQFSENLILKWVEPFSTFASLLEPGDHSPSQVRQPAQIVRRTWRMLMENHPHDSICGCSIDQVHEEMKPRFDQVDQVGEELTLQSLETIAANMDTSMPGASSAVVVFNPNSSTCTGVVCASVELPPHVVTFDLIDSNGASIPYQNSNLGSRELINMTMDAKDFQSTFTMVSDGIVAGMVIHDISINRTGSEVFINAVVSDGGQPNMDAWKSSRSQVLGFLADPSITTYHVTARSASAANILFTARAVPGLGSQAFWVRPRPAGSNPVHINPLIKTLLPLARLPVLQRLSTRRAYARPPYLIENDFFKVEAVSDGTLTLLDKRTGLSYNGLNRFIDGADCGDEYNYSPPLQDKAVVARLKHVRILAGPVQQSLEIELELEVPSMLALDRRSRSSGQVLLPITTLVTLTNGVPRLDIHTSLDNTARDHRLRVHFPAPFTASVGYHDGHFEVVERKVGLPAYDASWVEPPRPEVPQRAFTDINNGQAGLMLANRGLPEVEVLDSSQGKAEIALTILRCVGWLSRDDFSARKGHAGPFMETPGAQMLGLWSFDYSVIPHAGGWQDACDQAYAFVSPLKAVSTGLHQGMLSSSIAFVQAAPAGFMVTTVKTAETGTGWLVRGCNLTAGSLDVTIKPWRPFRKVDQVNLAEVRLASLKPDAASAVNLTVRPHEIVSFMFRD